VSADLNARAALFRALSHPARLGLLRLTWTEPLPGETLARLMNLAPATVSHHLAQLSEAGLTTVRQDGHHRLHGANHAALDLTLSALIRGEAAAPAPEDPYRARVLRSFMPGGQLLRIPAQRKKRDVILHELAGLFGPGRTYTEREVSDALAGFHPDFFTLRRELVGLGLLAREKGVYWRVTGRETARTPQMADDQTLTLPGTGESAP
jgi:ArsR family transcriptional regulator